MISNPKFTLTIINSSNKQQNVSLFAACYYQTKDNYGNPEAISITYANMSNVGNIKDSYKLLLSQSTDANNRFFISKSDGINSYDCTYIQCNPNGSKTEKPLNFSSTYLINQETEITYKQPANSKVIFEITFLQ